MIRYIRLDDNGKVIGIRHGAAIVPSEIQSDTGELGQIMQPDGTFIDDPNPPPIEKTELEKKVEQIMQDNLILMDALATVYEELIRLGEEIRNG